MLSTRKAEGKNPFWMREGSIREAPALLAKFSPHIKLVCQSNVPESSRPCPPLTQLIFAWSTFLSTSEMAKHCERSNLNRKGGGDKRSLYTFQGSWDLVASNSPDRSILGGSSVNMEEDTVEKNQTISRVRFPKFSSSILGHRAGGEVCKLRWRWNI